MATLEKIIIYPIKSLPGVEVEEAVITARGSLQHDREFALFDECGKTINGKKYPRLHLLRCMFDLQSMFVEISIADSSEEYIFNFNDETDNIEAWFSEYFKLKVFLKRDTSIGFPDDTDAYGPTVVSRTSISEVAGWFNLEDDEIIKRFRPNLIVSDTPPFWEDGLFGIEGVKKIFKIGEVEFAGSNSCNRCAVPTRNPNDSFPYPDFQKIFMEKREATLPEWAEKSRFNHYYKFCLNTTTNLQDAGKKIKSGDAVKAF